MSEDNRDSCSSKSEISFHHPDSIVSDERFTLRIDGVPSSCPVTVTARMDDRDGNLWRSEASYDPTNGTLDLDGDVPTDGSYTSPETTALIETMQPAEPQAKPYFPPDETTIEFTVSADGSELGRSTMRRFHADPDVRAVETPEGLSGTLYEPPGNESGPAAVLLHGGDGRPLEDHARLLASHGFVALALKYFNFAGEDDPAVPNGLARIPVEIVDNAVDWVLDRDSVSSSTVGMYGFSKGGELGLLAASRNDDIGAVVCLNGSALVWEGFLYNVEHVGSTWTIDGEPVPYVPCPVPYDELTKPYEYRPVYRSAYESATDEEIEAATIPVEEINGPVQFITGKDDQMWNTYRFNEHAIERLEEHDRPYDRLVFEDAGHSIFTPYNPAANREEGFWLFGGSADAYREADKQYWKQTLETLRTVE